jgi:hypothetical protein
MDYTDKQIIQALEKVAGAGAWKATYRLGKSMFSGPGKKLMAQKGGREAAAKAMSKSVGYSATQTGRAAGKWIRKNPKKALAYGAGGVTGAYVAGKASKR